jgi:protein-arginine kinase activator protein McsA
LKTQTDNLHSERISLQILLQSKNEEFDYVIENEENFEEAKILYREIKALKLKLKNMNQE